MKAPELIRERRTFPLVYGMYQALITRPLLPSILARNIDKQAYNFGYYRQIELVGAPPTMTISWLVPEDYLYHLDGLRVAWFNSTDTEPAQIMRFRLLQPIRNREWSVANPSTAIPEVPLELVTTPGRSWSASTGGVRYRVRENVTYGPNSVLQLLISGHTGAEPVLLKVLTEGLRIPRETFTNQ